MDEQNNFAKPPKAMQYFITIFMIVMGAVLLFCALFMPPHGEIHPSVLGAFGMILTFVGTSIGIDYNYKSKMYQFFSSNKPKRRSKQV